MGLQITPLLMGVLEVSGAVLQSNRNFFETIQSACFAWLIQGDGKNLLVDTGPSDPVWSAQHHRVMHRNDDQYLIPALKLYGLQASDIDAIVLTHLHWDHVYGCASIPHAPIYVQQKEIDYAKNPLPRDVRPYEADLDAPALKPIWDRLCPLHGDAEIMHGIRVLLTPGHTPGSQAVLVETANGTHALAGDTINLYSSLQVDPPWPPGIFVNLHDFYDSVYRLKNEADVILPSHDIRLLGRVFPEI